MENQHYNHHTSQAPAGTKSAMHKFKHIAYNHHAMMINEFKNRFPVSMIVEINAQLLYQNNNLKS